MKSRPGSVTEGPSSAKPDCTLTISDGDFVDMASGKISGQQVGDIYDHPPKSTVTSPFILNFQAFMSGKLKITGNVMMSQKLGALFQDQAKL